MQLQQCYIQYVPVAVPFVTLQLTLQLTKLSAMLLTLIQPRPHNP
jgi:hypothetical protein